MSDRAESQGDEDYRRSEGTGSGSNGDGVIYNSESSNSGPKFNDMVNASQTGDSEGDNEPDRV